MDQAVSFRPKKVYTPGRLKGYSNTAKVPSGIPHGTEVVLGSVQSPKIGYPVLELLHYDGDQTGSGYLHFRVTVNGQTLPGFDWADSYTAVGQDGSPEKIGENIPAGCLIEVRCKNEHPTDDTLKAWSEGEVDFYEQPI